MAVTMENAGIIQFENANLLRSYPFYENANTVSVDGKELPEGAIVDMRLVVPTGDSVHAELASVHMSRDMVSACVKVVRDGKTTSALSVTLSSNNFKPYTPYRLEKLAGTLDTGGIITFGDVEMPYSPETYFFSGLKVHPGCVVPFTPPKLRSIFDPRSGSSATGDVKIGFSGYVESKRNGKNVVLTLGNGADELASQCLRNIPLNNCGAEPIMSINNVLPDSEGRIVLWFH